MSYLIVSLTLSIPAMIRMCVRLSSDEDVTWTDEMVLRGNDGANWDMGYPRIVQRPDGKVVAVYYYNHALSQNEPPYRYIAATIFDPSELSRYYTNIDHTRDAEPDPISPRSVRTA